MRLPLRCLLLAAILGLGSCVTERVVDDGNEANRLIEEESSPALRQ